MKPDPSFAEIDALLRSRQPDEPPVPPGLEARILAALNTRPPPVARRWWPWLVLPPAFAAAILLLKPSPETPETPDRRTANDPTAPKLQSPPATAPLADLRDPLTAETKALGRDAQRAGSFLIDCLPAITDRDE